MEPKQANHASAQKPTLIDKLITRTPLRRILATGLATAMLYCGTAQLSRGASTPEKEEPAKQLIIPKPEAPDNIYQFFMDTAIRYAQEQNPESQQKASEFFAKAIELDKKKAVSFNTNSLDEATAKLYTKSLQQALAKDALSSLKDDGKKEKSWISRNWPLVLLGAGAAAAGIYFLTKKKSDATPTPEPVEVTIRLDAYNHTKGFKKDLEARTVLSGTTIDIPITEMGVSGVDTKYVAVYSEDFKTKIAFDSDGSATFTAPQNNIKYHVILFNKLGTNSMGQQVSYDWLEYSSLWNRKRNHVVYRRDFDGMTGPEKVWGGVALPEIEGARGVFDQLNSALNVGYTVWGHVDRQPNASSGDFSYGYANCDGHDGLHAGSWIGVNPVNLLQRVVPMIAIGLEEAFENLIGVNNVGGHSSSMTIQHWGVLNQNGKDLFVFCYIRDNASFSATGNNAIANAMNMVNVNQQFGPVEIGMSSGGLHTGFNNKSLGIRTSIRRSGKGFENYTTANFKGEKFQAGFGMLNSPSQQAYTAQAAMSLDKIMLGASGSYDAKSRQGNVAVSIGAPISRDASIMFGLAGTPGMLGLNAQAVQELRGVGTLSFRGTHTRNSQARYTALGLDAQLDKTLIGPIRIISDYTSSGLYKELSLGIGKPIGPGVLSISIVDGKGQRRSYDLRYTTSIKS